MKSKFKVLTLVIVSLLLLASCSNDNYQEAMDKGIESLIEKDYHQAAIQFELALKEKEGDEDASSYFEQSTQMKNALSAYEQKQYDPAIDSLNAVINHRNGLKTLQSEAKSLRNLVHSDQNITASFQKNLDLVKSLITKESYNLAEEKIQLLQKDIETNKILADYQSEVTKLSEQVTVALTTYEPIVQQTDTDHNEEKSNSKKNKKKKAKTFKYRSYANDRFGFSMQYPDDLTMDTPPSNGDGARFYNAEFEVTAYGGHTNIVNEGETIETYYQEELNSISGQIAYQKLTDDWYVVSYEENGQIFYEKFFFGPTVFNKFIISYPTNKQDKYDPVTTHIAKTFAPAAQ
ncbi:hypothetical protein [Peribacillus huizhouensis]|uniref:Uncharacterized protein YcfL n=1 Tax=Peribacillus huizhouensis TaxID=1501239 RepID=A0ABR6CTY3_9BACI|nr:hypothetical protein [Peribacillus huizhouensis]MBA9028484.1 uncharacterized protein YcfL [Peribacillus huizhouensis]